MLPRKVVVRANRRIYSPSIRAYDHTKLTHTHVTVPNMSPTIQQALTLSLTFIARTSALSLTANTHE